MAEKRKLRPVIDGEWRLIGPRPMGIDAHLPGAPVVPTAENMEHNACVDHHAFQSLDGAWHLWGCVRRTKVGRVLYHWEAKDLTESPWRDTGEFFRADRAAGECINDWHGQEWLQSPYVVRSDGLFYMFFGGHATGPEVSDGIEYHDPSMPMQMCLMTSPDGRRWTRHRNELGHSRIFAGPGEVRDPCVVKFGNKWYCYHAGFSEGSRDKPGFYCRTSDDLIHWSDPVCVHMDLKLSSTRWATECPFVVERGGYYYLFRTVDYYSKNTHVFRSEDPMNFGVGDSIQYHVGSFPAAAVEIYEVDGQEYVSSSHAPMQGTMLARMKWVEE